MKSLLRQSIKRVLRNPVLFELQQRICNNYEAIRDQYGTFLTGGGREILDIGCSTGACARVVIDMKKDSYTGIDIDEEYIKIAKRRIPDGNFIHMDARDLRFADEHFDIVMITGTMHHMDDVTVEECFSEVFRVLKKSGVVLVSEPLFIHGKGWSNFLLSLDRGNFIRPIEGYKNFFHQFNIIQEGFFKFSYHRFCSFVLQKGFVAYINLSS